MTEDQSQEPQAPPPTPVETTKEPVVLPDVFPLEGLTKGAKPGRETRTNPQQDQAPAQAGESE